MSAQILVRPVEKQKGKENRSRHEGKIDPLEEKEERLLIALILHIPPHHLI